ncbi:oligosaccharide flippase family protein [Heyndrickxia sporothermodurans]|uniref:lipopolysaccharide biosynthesis protein n=1 Tax=Heyndrickxia sporothermodurans TaxID=46224 RepID=UPI002DB67B83|nr:oligosaccharide flippase family protein [Heyndrickxia sporothermodurans]MEB6548865.1 oligosaccharide flippase family protein [Heyndrickxia sporothermodurans]
MNSKIKIFIQNFSYTFISNLLSVIISTVLILLVPKFVSVEDYGYWQLYIFYSSFISYMSLGLTDGAYLRFGGDEYKDLHKPVFVFQFWFLVLFDIVINLSIAVIYSINSMDPNKSIVVFLTCLTGVLVVPRSLLTFMLQATNRIKEYSIIIIIERVFYFILVIIFLFVGIDRFEYLIFSDIFGKLFSIIYACFICRELVFGKFDSIKNSVREIWVNISVGSKLLFANFASMLIIGIVRFCIERKWSVETFGKVSLTISISNMLMLFINAIGLILFPTLRRTSEKNLPSIYKMMRTVIMVPLLILLIFYYPAKLFLSIWLPQYTESFIYMALLFPMCIYESKTVLLINTYLKTLRKEKVMLIINLITVAMSIVLTYFSVYLWKSLYLSVLSITLLLAFRSIIAELHLSKALKIKVRKDIVLEVCMTGIFITVSWYLKASVAWIIYFIALVVYLYIKKSEIVYLLKKSKSIKKSK